MSLLSIPVLFSIVARTTTTLSAHFDKNHGIWRNAVVLLEWPAGADRLQRTEVRGSHAA